MLGPEALRDPLVVLHGGASVMMRFIEGKAWNKASLEGNEYRMARFSEYAEMLAPDGAPLITAAAERQDAK